MLHDARVVAEIARQVPEIVRIRQCGLEVLKINGEAGIERMSPQVDDAGVRQRRVNEAER